MEIESVKLDVTRNDSCIMDVVTEEGVLASLVGVVVVNDVSRAELASVMGADYLRMTMLVRVSRHDEIEKAKRIHKFEVESCGRPTLEPAGLERVG